MTVNPEEFRSAIGLDNIHIAEVVADNLGAYTVKSPEYLAPAAEVSAKPATKSETQYADDKPFDSVSAEGGTEMELTITNLPAQTFARLTGSIFDEATGRIFDNADPASSPYFAIGFRSQKANGKYRYYWYFKCRFEKPEEGYSTKKESVEYKEMKIKCNALKTVHAFDLGAKEDGLKRVYGDEDTANFSAANWFSAVQVPA